MILNIDHHSLFPTSISQYKIKIDDSLDYFLDKISENNTEVNGLISQGYRTKSNYALDDPILANLKTILQECVKDYCDHTGISHCSIKKSWLCSYEAFGNIKQHRHELSVVSGVYYVYCDDLSGYFVVENPSQPFKVNEVSTKTTVFTAHRHYLPVEKNTLILFPSWLYHYTEANFSEKKISLSFDCCLED